LKRVIAVSAPYGIPLNTFIPSSRTPLTFPAVVLASGAPSAHVTRWAPNATEAAATPVQRKKLRRFNRFIERSHQFNREKHSRCSIILAPPHRLDTAMRRRLNDALPLPLDCTLARKKIPGL
jgi:hypothetical protein